MNRGDQTLLLVWLGLFNLVTFAVYGWDKRCAKRKGARRVSEAALLLLAVFGGSIGALLGMRIFHHKTLHKKFKYGVPAILLAQLLLCAVFAAHLSGLFE